MHNHPIRWYIRTYSTKHDLTVPSGGLNCPASFILFILFLFACLPFIFSFSFPIGFIMFACTRGYISLVQWHYFKNCQWWHDALHNVFKNRRHTLPIYLTVVSINYLTKNTFTSDGFQSYKENRRLLLLIYAVILKLSTFFGIYVHIFSDQLFLLLLLFLTILLIIFFFICVFIVFFFALVFICFRFFLLAFYCSRQQQQQK